MSEDYNHEATELELHISNHRPSYEDLVYTLCNLRKHHLRGNYDSERALKGLKYPVIRAAEDYVKQYGTDHTVSGCEGDRWYRVFSVATRAAVCRSLLAMYEEEITAGDSWLDDEIQRRSWVVGGRPVIQMEESAQ